jgi:hypothetical protein
MENKNELIQRINDIKEFELKEVAIKKDNNWIQDDNWKAVVIKDEENIIATVSQRYRLLQFSEVFLPIVEKMADTTSGSISTYKGKATLHLFPEDNSEKFRTGVCLKNSVDKSMAIEARFSILLEGGYTVAIPKEIKPFRKTHTGKALEITQDFMAGLGDIKSFWNDIVKKYTEFEIDSETIDNILKELKVTKRMQERIRNYKTSNLYELFMATLREFSLRKYKSDLHRQKKVETLVEIFYNFSIQTRLTA